jgi:Tfp pilus assembly protein PilF
VTREEVTIALADRALVKDDVVDPSTMNSFTEQAIALLDDGQRNAAAALFDAARTLKPADIAAQNNYAFCILIDKPEQARSLLAGALSRGAQDPAVTLCNLALAESLLGHTDQALAACEQAYGAADDGMTAYLWRREDENWNVEHTKARPWAARLGVELEKSGEVSPGTWAERLERLILLESQAISSDPSSAETGEADL